MCTDLTIDAIKKLKKGLKPRDLKARLGLEIVKRYHGEAAAKKAQENWEKLFSKKETPKDIPLLKLPKSATVIDAVVRSGVAKSKSEAWRLIQQGGVEIDGARASDPNQKVSGGVVRIGKKNFFRVVI